ncbi:MAG: hypothetical protein IJP84_09175 [Lachnospiraceae bacterium]|nr:hypothetical protein [Lachnospiraceae bacterium]
MTTLQIMERQNEIIRLQADSINELFKLLIEHISVEEADSLPVLKKINLAAELRAEIKETID